MTENDFFIFEKILKRYIETIIRLEEDKEISDFRSYRKRIVEQYDPLVLSLKELLVIKE